MAFSKKKSVITRITADEAAEIAESKTYAFEKTLKVIRSIIDGDIRNAAKLGKKSTRVTIPTTVFGHENYDINAMGRAVARQLFEDKFTVTGTCASLIISWGDGAVAAPPPTSTTQTPKTSSIPRIRVPTPKKR